MKYIDADRLRAEIERRMETCDANSKTPDQLLWAELGALIAFLDTLEEPEQPTRGYDEAYLNEKIAKASKSWKGVDVDKYMDEVRGREPVSEDLEEEIKRVVAKQPFFIRAKDQIAFARHFTVWGAEHAKKDETPVSEELEEAANEFANQDCVTFISRKKGFIAGAEWQEKRWENNRLMAQDHATEEECQREMDFVDNHIKKHHRIPTFSDAINYGIEWQKKQMPLPEDTLIFRKGVEEGRRLMMEDAVEGEVIKTNKHTSVRYKSYYGTDRYFYGIADKQFKAGDKVRIIILPKEDGE